MLIELLIGLVVLFVFTYKFLDDDIFAPGVIICLSYILATACACVNMEYWQIDLSLNTFLCILGGVGVMLFGNYCVYFFIQPSLKNTKLTKKEYKKISVSRANIVVICLYDVVAVAMYFLEVRKIGGGGSFSDMMYQFRQMILYNGASVSVVTNQLVRLVTAASVVCLYIFAYNVFLCKDQIKKNIVFLIPVVLDLIYALLSSGRYRFLQIPLELIFLYAFFYFKTKSKRIKINLKFIVMMLVCVFALLFLFYGVRELSGRSSNQAILEYVSTYFGGSIELFDLYMKGYNGPTSEVFGVLSFSEIYKYIEKFLGIDIKFGISGEFRRSTNGILVGNVYTSFRDYIQDFGYIGIVMVGFLTSIIWSISYYKSLLTEKAMPKILFSYLSYGMVLHSYSEQFFTIYLSLDIWMIIFLVYLMYLYFTKVKIKC